MSMRAIETTAMVGVDGTLTLQVPADVKPGEHQVVIILNAQTVERGAREPLEFPVDSYGP